MGIDKNLKTGLSGRPSVADGDSLESTRSLLHLSRIANFFRVAVFAVLASLPSGCGDHDLSESFANSPLGIAVGGKKTSKFALVCDAPYSFVYIKNKDSLSGDASLIFDGCEANDSCNLTSGANILSHQDGECCASTSLSVSSDEGNTTNCEDWCFGVSAGEPYTLETAICE